MDIPAALIAALSGQAKSTISLVIGAGTSLEGPTSLKLSSEYADTAHALLVASGVIQAGDCVQPEDLSCVADAVWGRTGHHTELVARLPHVDFVNASSNIGHRTAAALLREQVIGAVLTLNYDRAMAHALSDVNVQDSVVVIAGPEQHANYGGNCVIHLHRDATAPADSWILRTDQLTEAWKDRWEQLMATCVAARPVVVFVGLGSPAAVLTESVKRIRKVVKNVVVEVGPHAGGQSEFSQALQVPPENHVQAGWCAFMIEIGRVVARVQVEAIRMRFAALADPPFSAENAAVLVGQLRELDLLQMGAVRAAWMLSEAAYESEVPASLDQQADLLHAIAVCQRITGLGPQLQPSDGSVEFLDPERTRLSVFPITGQGRRRAAIEEIVHTNRRIHERRRREPVIALVTGVVGPAPTLPGDLIAEPVDDDIVSAEQAIVLVDVDEFRVDPSKWLAA